MIKCLIVDDEPPARELLQRYLEPLEGFMVLDMFDNALNAFSFLQSNQVDLMFLDIQMPRMNGIELLKSLRFPPKVIMTTAFRDYAVDGFELDILDYLLKPISPERFLKSISKFHFFHEMNQPQSHEKPAGEDAYLFLKVDRDQVKVFLKDILFIEGLKDYIRVHTTGKVLIAYERLGYMEEKLPEGKFIRIHKSFIVSIDKIIHFNNEKVQLGKSSTIKHLIIVHPGFLV